MIPCDRIGSDRFAGEYTSLDDEYVIRAFNPIPSHDVLSSCIYCILGATLDDGRVLHRRRTLKNPEFIAKFVSIRDNTFGVVLVDRTTVWNAHASVLLYSPGYSNHFG